MKRQTGKNGQRRLPIGAEATGNAVHFRVWAPAAELVELADEQGRKLLELEAEIDGYFSGQLEGAGAGLLYWFRLNGEDLLLPDPASRFQPKGPHGPSQVIDPESFPWTDANWPGVQLRGQVIYELHVGSFSREGTWEAAALQMKELWELGIRTVEIMPVADFPGRFGWGYDCVNFFAPTRLYGQPSDFRQFVDFAHSIGMGVILDVVWNHAGPDGNNLDKFSPDYFSKRYAGEWGQPLNFDGENSRPVREYFIANARYWISEYHLDGFRIDATQGIFDASEPHVIAEIVQEARAAAGERHILIIGENEPQHSKLIQPIEEGGYGLDALWNDDFHHTAIVALTGRDEAYYSDYRGSPQEFVSVAKWGFLYQGQFYQWQKKGRGTPAFGINPERFVTFLENHDQVANSLDGHRSHQSTSPARHRVLTALTLLMPATPLLFQGQEFSTNTPFLYFADHKEELKEPVRKGRAEFLKQFPSIASPEVKDRLADPFDPRTFERCKLNFEERETHKQAYQLHRDLLRLRREDPVFNKHLLTAMDGAVLGTQAFVLRYFGRNWSDRLLLVNFGVTLHLAPAPEPLLASPPGKRWQIIWSSESVHYGGHGTPPLDTQKAWTIPAETAVVLRPSHLPKGPSDEQGSPSPQFEI
jgi:maltooligosyltrehalose trehalohydrolase